MTKTKFLKLLGLLAALATGVVSIASGDMVTGVGVIAAALSSSSALTSSATSAN